jgi:L-arabinose isomerase
MAATNITSTGIPAPAATLKPFVQRKPRIGLFIGAMEWYWTMTGMEALKDAVVADGQRLTDLLTQQGVDVLSTELIASHDDAAAAGRRLRDQKVDLVVFYHGTYVDDKMTFAFLDEYGDGAVVLAHTQGLDEIPEDFSLIDYARCWGNNSCVQIISSAKRMRPNRTLAYAFGHMPDVAQQVASYARAAKAITNVKNCKVGFLPHRCNDAPMYDTFPDETQMMSQTGIAITYCYIHELEDELKHISKSDEEALLREVLDSYTLQEPHMDELRQAVRVSIALERVVAKHELDAVGIEAFSELTYRVKQLPHIGANRLMDRDIVVTCEGDLTCMVGGLYMRELAGHAPHFWEHLMFDTNRNWILGGHDGGSAGFKFAARQSDIALRNTMYIEYKQSPPAPPLGVVPEFILKPGRVTWINLFRDQGGYVMRAAAGESVDTPKRPVHHEHLVFKPDVPLDTYFNRMMHHGAEHHFAFCYGDWVDDLRRLAELLGMPLVDLTQSDGGDCGSV